MIFWDIVAKCPNLTQMEAKMLSMAPIWKETICLFHRHMIEWMFIWKWKLPGGDFHSK